MVKSRTLLITMILMIASFLSLSHAGYVIKGLDIATVQIHGVLYCSVDGNPLAGSTPLSGATVYMTCAGQSINLGQAVTNPAGAFTVVVKILDTVLFDPTRCFVRLNLPVLSCAVFPPDGVLTATVNLVDVIQSALGNIAEFVTNDFIYSTF